MSNTVKIRTLTDNLYSFRYSAELLAYRNPNANILDKQLDVSGLRLQKNKTPSIL